MLIGKKRVERVEDRVAWGATFLDCAKPGWDTEINLARFGINNVENCVLGQLYGDYEQALDVLRLDMAVCEALGFQPVSRLDTFRLNVAWRRELRRRMWSKSEPEPEKMAVTRAKVLT